MRRAVAVLTLVLLAGCGSKPSGDVTATLGEVCRPANAEKPFAYGIVTNAQDGPLSSASVVARALAHRHEMSATTDGSGCYTFAFPVAQPHDIEAAKGGYRSQTVESVMLNDGEARKINFRLDPA